MILMKMNETHVATKVCTECTRLFPRTRHDFRWDAMRLAFCCCGILCFLLLKQTNNHNYPLFYLYSSVFCPQGPVEEQADAADGPHVPGTDGPSEAQAAEE